MSDYKTELQSNNVDLQSVLSAVQGLGAPGFVPEVCGVMITSKASNIWDVHYIDEELNYCINSDVTPSKNFSALRNTLAIVEFPIPNEVDSCSGCTLLFSGRTSNGMIALFSLDSESASIEIKYVYDGGLGA